MVEIPQILPPPTERPETPAQQRAFKDARDVLISANSSRSKESPELQVAVQRLGKILEKGVDPDKRPFLRRGSLFDAQV